MPKRRYYQNRSKQGKFKYFVFGILLIVGAYFSYETYFCFNPERLVENSVLKEKTFETEVKEIVSPKYKIKAYLFEDDTNPIIAISFLFKNAGYAGNEEKKDGLAQMVAALLDDGTEKLDRVAYREELEKYAINIGFSAGRDDMNGTLLTTKAQSKRAFGLLKGVLKSPRFDDEDINQVCQELLMGLKVQQEQPQSELSLLANRALFGRHPYAKNPLGESQDIARISRADLLEYVKNHFTRSNLIVGIAGDISVSEAGVMLDNVFGGLPENGKMAFIRNADVDFASEDVFISKDLPQSIAFFVVPGVSRQSEDFYPLYVANDILGGSGLTSRLSLAAREKEALTYGIYTYLNVAEKAPLVGGSYSATPENFDKVKEIVKKEWQKVAQNGVSKEEFDAEINYLLSSYNLRFASITNIADILTAMQKENLGIDFLQKRNDYIRNIKLQDVNMAAKKYFAKNPRFIEIGNNDKKGSRSEIK